MSDEEKTMRTKRRYAHELYPHPAEDEVQPLAVAVPYLYARALGWDVQDTSWSSLLDDNSTHREYMDRTMLMIAARGDAFIADALLQGLSGQEAWDWAGVRNNPEGGEWIYERAVHYGIDPEVIKPYLCGPEPDRHTHYDPPDARGWRTGHSIVGRESDCDECCEPLSSVSS